MRIMFIGTTTTGTDRMFSKTAALATARMEAADTITAITITAIANALRVHVATDAIIKTVIRSATHIFKPNTDVPGDLIPGLMSE